MARTRVAKFAFNRGLVSRLGLARADIKRLAMASEIQVNWVPRVLGSMMLRPGTGYLGSSRNDARPFHIPFVFSIADKADVELTDAALRVWVSDAVITRVAVSTAIANGTFDINLVGWTDADEVGGVSDWVAGGYMGLTGNGTAFAIRRQQVAVAAADQNKEHALHITIERGPVVLRVGSALGNDDYINETELLKGSHSLALTPTGANVWIEFKSRLERIVLVSACTLEAAGAMVVESPYLAADLTKIRHDQSGDVLFLACDGYQQTRIERRATRSWSVVTYQPDDGPFMTENTGKTTLTPSVLSGNGTLTASAPTFRSGHLGALFAVTSTGQTVSKNMGVLNDATNSIRVTGVTTDRAITINLSALSGTGNTVILQRSFDNATWVAVPTKTWAADTVEAYTDGLDNQIVYYRLLCSVYAGGLTVAILSIPTGSIRGIARITTVTSNVLASIEVLTAFGATSASATWEEGAWSTYRGFPSAVAFHEGRLTWAGRDKNWLSISDVFDGFDPDFAGDAGPISRSIGSGPVDTINWLLSLQRLIMGGQGAEFSIRSSSLDEPITPSNYNLKAASTQGSAAVAAVKVDQQGIFVQRGGIRVYELSFGNYSYGGGIDYEPTHLSALVPEIGSPGIIKMMVQRQPDTRVHFLRSDGTVAMLVFDRIEQVICWLEIETDGVIEDGVILPGDAGDEEDHVYYDVKRTINGATKRYHERWAFESECRGGTLSKQADCFVTYNQAASSTIAGLSHLEAKAVVVWDNGKCLADANGDIATFTVSGGRISVTNAGVAYQATQGVVGLPYSGSWMSAKMVELMEALDGSLTDTQMIKSLALILADVHPKGIKYGDSLTESDMNDLPEIEEGETVDADTMRTDYASQRFTFPGAWSSDARLCLLAKAPRPCTVLAAIAELEHHG